MNGCLLCARPATRLKRRAATGETVRGVVTVQWSRGAGRGGHRGSPGGLYRCGCTRGGQGCRGRAAPEPAAGLPGVAASLTAPPPPHTRHLHGGPEANSHGAGPTLAKCRPKYRKGVSQNTLQRLVFKIPGGPGRFETRCGPSGGRPLP